MKNTYYSYDITKVINVVLFIIHSFGNKIHVLLLNRILYDADVLHLSRYGYLVMRDKYMLMKNGLVPVNTYVLYTHLLGEHSWMSLRYDIREYFFTEGNFIHAHQNYNSDILTGSEVSCLFEAIRKYKSTGKIFNEPPPYVVSLSMALFNEISVLQIARLIGVNNSMYAYILDCLQANSFSGKYERKSLTGERESKKIAALSGIVTGSIFREHTSLSTYIVVGMSLKEYTVVKLIDEKIRIEELYEDLQRSICSLSVPYNSSSAVSLVNCTQVYSFSYDELYRLVKTREITFPGQVSAYDLGNILSALQESATIPFHVKEALVA